GIEHSEFAAETLQHDFGRVFLLAGLVGPLPCLQLALDIDLRSLAQVLLRNLDESLVEDHDAVPLGLLAPLAAVLVAPVLRSGHREVGDARAILRAADFGIAAEIADQDNLVHAACHDVSLRSLAPTPTRRPANYCGILTISPMTRQSCIGRMCQLVAERPISESLFRTTTIISASGPLGDQPPEMQDRIIVRGAREHNLKNVDAEMPRNSLVVITGLSGSGKSSLAFDTIY